MTPDDMAALADRLNECEVRLTAEEDLADWLAATLTDYDCVTAAQWDVDRSRALDAHCRTRGLSRRPQPWVTVGDDDYFEDDWGRGWATVVLFVGAVVGAWGLVAAVVALTVWLLP